YHGLSIAGASLYCTDQPCVICAKMLINAGIKKILYEQGYADELSQSMLAEAGVELRKIGSGEGSDR
ncbi:MAG: cytidine deaminase, partial [Deltaproteobacteria bacterium]|nr:cytidine deaminase [Deltaproteobacteria bacterium]